MTTRIDTHLPTGYAWQTSMADVERICREGRARQAAREAQEKLEAQAVLDDGRRKRCNICRKPKPLAMFSSHVSNRDGLDGRCKPCKARYDRDRIAKQREAASLRLSR